MTPLTPTERYDLYDDRLANLEADLIAEPVALLEKGTGRVLTTFESLEVAFEELADVSDDLKRDAFLGWLPPPESQASRLTGWQSRLSRAVAETRR